jgi:hypothetical protein
MKEQIRLILDGINLPDSVYEEFDVSGLDDKFYDIDETGSLFSLDGSDYGPTTVTYYIHCANAAELWPKIQTTVSEYPLCKGASVEFHNTAGEIYKTFKLIQ